LGRNSIRPDFPFRHQGERLSCQKIPTNDPPPTLIFFRTRSIMNVRSSLPLRALFVLVSLLAVFEATLAQPPQPVKPNPQAPTIGVPVPLGMKRGTVFELTLTGTNLAGPTALWTSFPCKATFPTDNNNGKDNTKLRVRLVVPPHAPLGFHSIRLATTRGMSNFRLFCIDDLPQIMEVDTNRSRTTPQAVKHPCVVVGRADADVSDWYKVTVKAGERLTFEVLGRRLGSAFDPQLSLYEVRTGREIAHDNDAPGCQADPRLTYTFKEAGDYLIEIKDVLNRGGPDFWYRLRIGDFPCATVPIPMAAKRGTKVQVSFAGPNVEGVAPVQVEVPTDPTISTIWVAPRGSNGLYGWPVALATSDLDEKVEQEPNNEIAKANRISVPGAITGRFQQSDDLDYYQFTAKKGQRLLIEAHTLEHHSPTLVYMILKDAKGADLAKTNPQANPPLDQRIDHTIPADGEYFVEVQHLNYQGNSTEAYRLTVTPYEPGFELTMALDRYDVAPGSFVSLPLLASRHDYTGPIEVSVLSDHPGISGKMTIPAGVPKSAPTPPKGVKPPPQPAGTLMIHARTDMPMGAHVITIQAKATINNKTVISYLQVRNLVSQNLGGLPYPPQPMFTEVAVAVKEKPPFALAAKFDQPQTLRGQSATVTITATREPGFTEEITLTPPVAGLPPNVTAALKNIPKDQKEVKVELKVAANAPLGQFMVQFSGKGKYQNKEFIVQTMPVPLVLASPFDLKVEPVPLKITQGDKAKLKVIAARKGGYKGPINVEIRNLPANVTATKATIAEGQTTVELEITAADNAAVASKADVNVLGTAVAAANQQAASPNFTVSVVKK
jgi:hypothetical protein